MVTEAEIRELSLRSTLLNVAERVDAFIRHLRLNGFAIGRAQTELVLRLLRDDGFVDPAKVGERLKILLCTCAEDWRSFDALFEAYWYGKGIERPRAAPRSTRNPHGPHVQSIWRDHLADEDAPRRGEGLPQLESDAEKNVDGQASGRLIASRAALMRRVDLRHIVDPHQIQEAEVLAYRLAAAMRYRLSRRYRLDRRGARLNMRRTIRANLSRGGEPLKLIRQKTADRPVRLVVLLDVSGSMKHYNRFFLQFVKGLVGEWLDADAYLMHTRLVRVTDALRDRDVIRAMTRLGLLADGFGGGTKLGACLQTFNTVYAKRALNSRSVVMILSDGYDTGDASVMCAELSRLKRHVRRLVWLNPLLGWQSYAPVTRAMREAMPLIDCFAAANTLDALAAIEPQLRKL